MNNISIIADHTEKEMFHLPVNMITPNPCQPRRYFDPIHMVDLAHSIKQHGVMQPISVRMIEGGYELIAGERRLRASILANIDTIPAIIISASDEQSAVLAMVENLQRADLNYIEEAEGLAAILAQTTLTQDEMARKIGRSQSTIANKLRLLRLGHSVKKLLLENNLSERHARALLKIEKEDSDMAEKLQIEAITRIIKDDLNVKKTEEMITRMLSNIDLKAPTIKPKSYISDVRFFTNTIKQAVEVMQNSGMATEYDIEETDGGCFITIAVTYSTDSTSKH